jgi:hypothetical protein
MYGDLLQEVSIVTFRPHAAMASAIEVNAADAPPAKVPNQGMTTYRSDARMRRDDRYLLCAVTA